MSTEDWNNLNGNHEDLKPLSDPRPVMAPVLNPTTISQSNIQPVTQPVVEETASVSETKKKKKEKPSKEKDTSSSSDLKKIMAVAVCAAMFGGIAGMGGMMLYSRNWGNQVRYEAVSAARKAAQNNDGSTKKSNVFSFPDSTTILQGERDYTAINTVSVNTNEKHTAAEVYAANVNSTVGINTSIDYNYYGYETTAAASGSGFILTSDGYIVTNHHVVDGAKEVQVTTYDGTTYDAVIVGFDESNDLAVLKIEASDLTPVVIGNSDQMNVGDEVLAIGNPLGELTFSLTTGCVSALNRSITINNQPMDLIQTDCAINAGNSGGALFNLYGEVIGITNAKYSNSSAIGEAAIENIGFAIPINNVKQTIDSIIENGCFIKPYIGVYVESIDSSNASSYGMDHGVGIHDVMEDSPSEKAGLKNGDVIIKIDGNDIKTTADLHAYISRAGVGGVLKLTISRDGKELEIEVTIEESQVSALET